MTVVAECTMALTTAGLLTVPALRLPLILLEIVGTRLVQVGSAAVLLLVETCPILLTKVGLCGAALLSHVALVRVLELRLVVALVEVGGSVITVKVICPVVQVTAVDIVGVVIVPVDVVGVDVITIDIVGIDVVAIVVIVTIYKGIRVGDVGVVVVHHRGVVPSASPGVPAPNILR